LPGGYDAVNEFCDGVNALYEEENIELEANCPFCGCDKIRGSVAEWQAKSLDKCDPNNECVIVEHQCVRCSRSFWA